MIASALLVAFNLLCTGEQVSMRPADAVARSKPKPFSVEYRVDPEMGLYCEAACEQIQRIGSLDPARIIFRAPGGGTTDAVILTEIVSRESGDYMRAERSANGAVFAQGRCKQAPFSGFPSGRP